MIKQRILNIFTFLQPVILLGVIGGGLHIWHLIAIIIINIFCITKEEAGIVLTLILPPFVGKIAPFFLPIPGTIICLLLTLIFLNTKLLILFETRRWLSYKYIILLLLIFIIYYMNSAMGEEANQKIIGIFVVTILSCISFCLITEHKHITPSNLALFYGLCAISYLSLAYDLFGYQLPNDFLDFDSFRSNSVSFARLELPTVSYHEPALQVASASAFILSGITKLKIRDCLLIFTYFWIVLFTGARQGLVMIVILITVWFLFKEKSVKIENLLSVILVLFIFLLILTSLEVETIQNMFDSQETLEGNLNRNINYPLSLIKDGSLVGIGLGNYYNPYTGETYPHNIILEIILELGSVGFIVLFVLIICFCVENKVKLRKVMPNNTMCVIIYLPFFLRSMISGDLASNIIVFVAFFILFQKR